MNTIKPYGLNFLFLWNETHCIYSWSADVLVPDVHANSSRGQHTLSVQPDTDSIPQSQNLIKAGGILRRLKTWKIFIFNLFFTHTQVHTLSFPSSIQIWRWAVMNGSYQLSGEAGRELNELSLFWGLCMRIHCYIFTVASEQKKESGLVYGSFSLCPRWFSSLLKGKKKKKAVNISRTQPIQTSRQTTAFQFTFSFKTCEFEEKTPWIISPTKKSNWSQDSASRGRLRCMSGLKGTSAKVSSPDFGWNVFGQLLPSMRWRLGWHQVRLPSLASQHKHLLCLPTTISPNIKQQSLPAPLPPWPIWRINDPPSTLVVPYCPGLAGAGE